MRHIVCTFQNKSEFLSHLIAPAPGKPAEALTFLAKFCARPGEVIRVVIKSLAEGQQCSLKVRLSPGLISRAVSDVADPSWQYLGRIASDDRVWLEMFLAKLDTMERFRAA